MRFPSDLSGAGPLARDLPVRLLACGRGVRRPGMTTGWRTLGETVLVQARGGAYLLEFGDGRRYRARAGEGFAVPARQRHRISCPGPAKVESRWLHVSVEAVPGLDLFALAGVPAKLPSGAARRIGRAAEAILACERRAAGELARAFEVRRWLMDGVAAALALASAERLPAELERLWPALAGDPAEGASVPELARRCGLSPSRFFEVFRAAMGVSPNEWMLSRKLDRAARLLAHSALGCGQVAETCGFNGAAYFGRLFRARMGQTPGAYRRAQRDGGAAS